LDTYSIGEDGNVECVKKTKTIKILRSENLRKENIFCNSKKSIYMYIANYI